MHPLSIYSSTLALPQARFPALEGGGALAMPKALPDVGGVPTNFADMPGIAQPTAATPTYNFLGKMVSDISAKQTAAGDAVNGLLSGDKVPLHQAMVTMEEASVSFQLMVEVRNKLLESYQELMRMQI